MIAKAKSKLTELATRANRAHKACERAVNSALQHARDCKQALLEAKATGGHGHFEDWIGEHCRFSVRMARRYMTIAKGWDVIANLSHPGTNRTRASDFNIDSLSVREALRMLSAGGPEVLELQLLDQRCPACGERLMVTSKLYATCPACWDCRLYPYSHGAPRAPEGMSSESASGRARRLFRQTNDPHARAAMLAAMMELVDQATGDAFVGMMTDNVNRQGHLGNAARRFQELIGAGVEAATVL